MKPMVQWGTMLCSITVAVSCVDMDANGARDEGMDGVALERAAMTETRDAQSIHAQSTTGPVPPRAVQERDSARQASYNIAAGGAAGDVIISGVPSYTWRHGCGPTAVGMVIGYYDAMGYSLIDGDASTQTDAVNQAIASGGDKSNPSPAGSEAHFEDYAMPIDSGVIIADDYISAGRAPHEDNCIADYMDTSKSNRSNQYGWSWSSDIVPSFLDYVEQELPGQQAIGTSTTSLTWAQFTNEMDNDRPMVLLVDTDGDGDTDHFVTAIGYRETPTRQYACRDTWGNTIRWEDFASIANGQPWGIWGGFMFSLDGTGDHCDDGQKNGDETDLDCGGSCDGCPLTLKCNIDADCLSDYCVDGRCRMKPIEIPGRVEAEYYFGASDTTMGNEGDRECDHIGNADAELTSDVGGGCNVGWTEAGEYMDYEIIVPESRAFDITARVASQYAGTSLHVEIDSVDVTGSLVAPSNGWQSFEDRVAENVTIAAGAHTVRIFIETDYININYIDFTPSSAYCQHDWQCDDSDPCTDDFCSDAICFHEDNGSCGTDVPIPARIEAEDYVRYYDTTAGNEGGGCDTGDDVDKENTGDVAGGGCNVGWTAAGEWLEYDVIVGADQTFDITARVASDFSGRRFRIEIDGQDVTGALSVPANGWQNYSDVTAKNIAIASGSHVVRFYMITDYINVNYVDFQLSKTDCGNGTCDPWESCETCPQDCGACPIGCTCPSGCDAVVSASVGFVKNGADDTCYFLSGSAGNYINSWNTDEVNLNGQDITNTWIGASNYPTQSDGGYYLYVQSTVPWAHVEVKN